MAKSPGKSKFFRNRKVKTPIKDDLVNSVYKRKLQEVQEELRQRDHQDKLREMEKEISKKEMDVTKRELNLAKGREEGRRKAKKRAQGKP